VPVVRVSLTWTSIAQRYRGPGAKNPATGRCIVDWRVFDVGRPLTLGKVHLPSFIFTDVVEKASAVDLIREALTVYVFTTSNNNAVTNKNTQGETRTRTTFRSQDFKSCMSTISSLGHMFSHFLLSPVCLPFHHSGWA
jgi:hypothetical protein